MDADAVRALRELLADETRRAAVLEAMAPYLPAGGLPYAVDAAVDLFAHDQDASPALRAIATRAVELGDPGQLVGPGDVLVEYVAEDELAAFLDLAAAIPDAFREPRARMLAAIAMRLARASRPGAALLTFELAFRGARGHDWIAGPAAAVAAELDDPDDAERLLGLVTGLAPEARAPTLVALAPLLRPELAEALSETARDADEETSLRLYAAYFGTLPPATRAEQAEAVLEDIREAPPTLAAIAALGVAETLEEPQRTAAVSLGLEAAAEALREKADEPAWTPSPWFWNAIVAGLELSEDVPQLTLARELLVAAGGLSADWRAEAFSEVTARLQRPDHLLGLAEIARDAAGPYPTPAETRLLRRFVPGAAYERARTHERLVLGPVLDDVAPEDRPRVIMTALAPAMAGPPPEPEPEPYEPSPPSSPPPEPEPDDWYPDEPPPAPAPEPYPDEPPPAPAPEPYPDEPPPEPESEPEPEPEPESESESESESDDRYWHVEPDEPTDPYEPREPQAPPVPPPAPAPSPPPAHVPTPPPMTPPRPAVVNTGFADPAEPGRGVSRFQPLHPGDWHFWLEVGEPLPESIETQPVGLLASVPSGCTVTVALYPVSEGVEILDGFDTAELEVRPDGSAIVTRGAAALADAALARRRVAFPVRVAPGTAEVELRCSIFRRQMLVQSRRIRARVAGAPTGPGDTPVLTSDVDYLLVRRLVPRALTPVADHGLSLMLNGDGATHNLHALVAGDDVPITHSTRFEGGELQDMIVQTRRALRLAAFESQEPWHEGDDYRYAGPPDNARLEEDLLELAVRGYRFYDHCINRLAGSVEASIDFAERTRRPTRIQIALRRNGGLVLPAAVFYDHPLDSGEPDLRLCPEFLGAVGDLDALHALPCFAGACPHHDDLSVVCPSGFWGFRHDLGLPLSLDEFGEGPANVSFEIGFDAHPDLGVAVSTDPRFTLRAAHEQELRALRPDVGWHYANTRADVIRLMRETPAQLLYFYCHGGLSPANAPFLGVGAVDEAGITSDVFRAFQIRWTDPRPLVFINGCHTTALEPDTALDFVSRLVDTAAAAGVLGTEITTFEPLAGAFATQCLRRFLAGEEIGAAVRGARLALLAQGNPLGLIYVPFVMPSVRLVEREAALSE